MIWTNTYGYQKRFVVCLLIDKTDHYWLLVLEVPALADLQSSLILSPCCPSKPVTAIPPVAEATLDLQFMGSSESIGKKNQAGDDVAFYEQSTNAGAVTLMKERIVDNLVPSTPTGEARVAFQSHQLPHNVSIDPITPFTVTSFRRIINLLLPIRYPDKFFAESTANVTTSSLARVAIWHEGLLPARGKREENPQSLGKAPSDLNILPIKSHNPSTTQSEDAIGTVVGGIQCRLEQLPFHPSLVPSSKRSSNQPEDSKRYCYIQTLALLSPYRSKGIGTALIEAIITTLCTEKVYEGTVSIYAHVWEANQEALEWYVKRGFQDGGVVEEYYRRLKPAGARVVWRDLGVTDYLHVLSR